MNNFLSNEYKIIYTAKRVNNFLNNAELKIILCKILEIVYVENNEHFFHEYIPSLDSNEMRTLD